MVFFHSLPVPELREWVFSIPFPFPNFGNGIIHSHSRSRTPKCHSRSTLLTNNEIYPQPSLCTILIIRLQPCQKITTAAIANRFVRTWVWNRIWFKNIHEMQNAFGMDNLALTWPWSINPIFEKSGDCLLDHLIFKETQTEDTFGPDRPFNHFYCSLWAILKTHPHRNQGIFFI